MIKTALKKVLSPYVRETRLVFNNLSMMVSGKKKLDTDYPVVCISNKNADTFFGYYDISPFRGDEVIYVVKHKGKDFLEIAINNIEGKSQSIVARTSAMNWQQGCRLRWFPTGERTISFNNWDGKGNYFNNILNLDTGDKKTIDYPLYDIDSVGARGLSIDFERLGRLRPGYGYTNNGNDLTPMKNHGIDVIDIHKNIIILTIDYERIISSFKRTIIINNCYLNHLSFSPDGSKFLFFLIEIINGYHMAYLLVYDMTEDKVIVLDEDEKVSHYVWLDNNSIICTAYSDPQTCRYYLYDVSNRSKTLIAPNSLDRDGHPSKSIKKDTILTDTYPDEKFFQHLMLADIKKDKTIKIADVYSDPHITGERRTDLHPRYNENQKYVSFDANISGNRKLYLIKINKA